MIAAQAADIAATVGALNAGCKERIYLFGVTQNPVVIGAVKAAGTANTVRVVLKWGKKKEHPKLRKGMIAGTIAGGTFGAVWNGTHLMRGLCDH